MDEAVFLAWLVEKEKSYKLEVHLEEKKLLRSYTVTTQDYGSCQNSV
jgi:hypothetical protein